MSALRAGLTTALAALLAACSAGVAGSAAVAAPTGSPPVPPSRGSSSTGLSSAAGGLQVDVVSTSVWTGDASLLLALSDAGGAPMAPPDAAVAVELTSPPPAVETVRADATLVRPIAGGRPLYRVDVRLPVAGSWRLDAAVDADGAGSGGALPASTALVVRDPGGVPVRGDRAPDAATPAAKDVDFDLARLTSDPIPETAFYWLSVPDALAAGRPFALIVDSFRFRETQACGGALGVIRHLATAFPTVSVIHVEPYATRFDGLELTLDPPGGPAALTPWSEAWGLAGDGFGTKSIPWIFVVRADGTVHGAFQGIVGTEELALALGDVSAWSPTDGGTIQRPGFVPTANPTAAPAAAP